MRFYIGQGMTKRQYWIYALLQQGKTVEEICALSKFECSYDRMEQEVQRVLDITDFCGRAHPNSIVITTHAYHRLIERYDGLLGNEIKDMAEDMMNNGRMISQEGRESKILYKDIVWVLNGNKIITIFWDNKGMRKKVLDKVY